MQTNKLQLIHLDDCPYLRQSWAIRSEKIGINYMGFESSLDLIKIVDQINKRALFFIDSNLREEKKGEEIAHFLHYDKNFKYLFISTGYNAKEFKPMAWVQEIIGKKYPLDIVNLHMNKTQRT